MPPSDATQAGADQTFDQRLSAVLARVVDGFVRLIDAERLSGGASQETYRIVVETDAGQRLLAMRRAAGGESAPQPDDTRPGLPVEALLMQVAGRAGVPEPTIHHVLEVEDGLGLGFIMEWLDGITLGARVLKAPELDAVRPRLAYQCGQALARIHAIDPAASGLDQHLTVMPTADFVHQMWDRYRAFDTPQPMVDFTARWLLEHLPPDSEPRLVHNDFRNGNIMFSDEGIVAVLDWEVAHLGDPIRDIGWICTNSWRFGRRDLPVGGFGELADLLAGYEAESGVAVDPEHVRFWEVFGSYWWAVGCLSMADRWRTGPDQTVERPGIARRSSECQVDCVNLIIPGPVELVAEQQSLSSMEMPSIDELIISVRNFLREDVREVTQGRNNFMALVASNSLDIVLRELHLGPAHVAGEHARLAALLAGHLLADGSRAGPDSSLDQLRRALSAGLQDGSIPLDLPGLSDHLRATVVNQVAIDQPRYSGFLAAIETLPDS
ncbi:MAG: phosphotransferase [Actinomycetota bacterium]|nr:phosphotransferase [Actinomycetota bacterium]